MVEPEEMKMNSTTKNDDKVTYLDILMPPAFILTIIFIGKYLKKKLIIIY